MKEAKSTKRQEVKSPVKSTTAASRPKPVKDSPVAAMTPIRTDHEVRIRRQASPIRSSASTSPSVATGPFTCDFCPFTSTRVNVIICHRKSHSSAEARSASTTPTAKSVQKRTTPASSRKSGGASKRKKTTEEDLFDQVKRNLDASGAKESTPKGRRKSAPKSAKNTPTAASSATKEATTRKSPVKTPSASAGTSKARHLCPKKKWLNLSQKEENPEVKLKLMADWDEEEDEEASESKAAESDPSATPAEAQPAAESREKADSDSEDERPSKFGLLHQRSDDEEDEEAAEPETEAHPPESESAAEGDEGLANISAEIDKLNAEMGQMKPEEKPLLNGQPEKANGLAEATDQLKQDVASLLSETTVPVLPEIMSLKADPLDADGQKEAVNGTNILMQVEGSNETYMVMWEPGSNIQDLLTYEGQEEGAHQTLIINQSALPPATELENIFQMAVDNAAAAAAAAAASSQNEQST